MELVKDTFGSRGPGMNPDDGIDMSPCKAKIPFDVMCVVHGERLERSL